MARARRFGRVVVDGEAVDSVFQDRVDVAVRARANGECSGARRLQTLVADCHVTVGDPKGLECIAEAFATLDPALHPVELNYLEAMFGFVPDGRYFLLADGRYGVEGGPVAGSFAVAVAGGGAGRRSILGHSDIGSVIGDGDVVGFIDGATGVTCGPDGGCIY